MEVECWWSTRECGDRLVVECWGGVVRMCVVTGGGSCHRHVDGGGGGGSHGRCLRCVVIARNGCGSIGNKFELNMKV